MCTIDCHALNTIEKARMSKIFYPVIQQLREAKRPILAKSPQVHEIIFKRALTLKLKRKQELSRKKLCLKFNVLTRFG